MPDCHLAKCPHGSAIDSSLPVLDCCLSLCIAAPSSRAPKLKTSLVDGNAENRSGSFLIRSLRRPVSIEPFATLRGATT